MQNHKSLVGIGFLTRWLSSHIVSRRTFNRLILQYERCEAERASLQARIDQYKREAHCRQIVADALGELARNLERELIEMKRKEQGNGREVSTAE